MVTTKQNILAKYFNKSFGEFLYSGTLSIETALVTMGIIDGDYVIIPDNVCYRIILSVLRLHAIPIIINPANNLFLTTGDVQEVLKKYNVKALIIVHNYGLPADVKSFKNICKEDTLVIEDAAQAWDLRSKGNPTGKYSDYVATSFGPTKPLSLGIGGALFSDNPSFLKYLDYKNKSSRESSKILLPYVLPESLKFNLDQLIKKAYRIAEKQRKVANILIKKLKKIEYIRIWEPEIGDCPTWTRFPIWFKKREKFLDFLRSADKYKIIYEIPHKLGLANIPLSIKNKSIAINTNSQKPYHIIIKTRFNQINVIKNWINEYGAKT